MGPNTLFSFDQFINMTIFYPLITFWRLPCSSSTGINNRAAGRRAVAMVFASPPRQFYHDGTTPAHLSGLSHLDNFIVTRKSCQSIGTVQKRMPTPTRTATPYTTGPLCCNNVFASVYPLAQNLVCGCTGRNI
jgi:hypothetical protein